MIFGKTTVGATAVELARDYKALSRMTLTKGKLPKLRAYLDGLGGGDDPFALTLSGNEIGDIVRGLAIQGDGRVVDGTTGLYRAATNLVANGGFETNTTGWSTSGFGAGSSIFRDGTRAKFGSNSLRVILGGASAWETVGLTNITGLASNTPYVVSCWVYSAAGTGTLFFQSTEATSGGAFIGNQSSGSFALVAGWQRLSWTYTTAVTAGQAQLQVVGPNPGVAFTYWLDGAQFELGGAPTPYVHTNGGTATRAAARVQLSSTYVNRTTGWVAMRYRPAFPNTATPGGGSPFPGSGSEVLFDWEIDGSNSIICSYSETSSVFRTVRLGSGLTGNASSAAQTFAAGAPIMVVFAWDATHVYVSVNGAAFVVGAQTNIPAGTAPANADIGSQQGTSRWMHGDVMWLASGAGPISSPDLATISGLVEPANLAALPSATLPGLLWKAQTSDGQIAGTGTGNATVMPELYDASGNLVAAGDPVTVVRGSAAAWYDLTFSAIVGQTYFDGVAVNAAGYDVGVHAGGAASNIVRYRSDGAGVGKLAADLFSDGAAATLGTATATLDDQTIYGDVFTPWTPPAGELEFYYGRLPFKEAQQALSTTRPLPRTGIACAGTWHGTTFDPERGSFVVLQTDGVLDRANLVGERVKITTRTVGAKQRSVYAFVHNTGEIPVAKGGVACSLSLPRRLWLALALPGDNIVNVTVERLK